MKTNVFVDMDNVLANFSYREDSVLIYKEKGFFRTLPPIGENVAAARWLARNKKYKVYIISSVPNRRAVKDKVAWLRQYLPEIPRCHMFFCREGSSKACHTFGKRGWLLDDYCMNIQDWQRIPYNYAVKITKDFTIKDVIQYIL